MKIGTDYYWYHNDHLGTPQKLTTTSGAVVWAAKYTSFGNAAIDPSSTVVNPLRFPGQYEDDETGLYYNWFRYYHSDIGRYNTTDPIGFGGGFNLYSYVENQPLIKTDPFGLFSKNCGENYNDCYNRCTSTGAIGVLYNVTEIFGYTGTAAMVASTVSEVYTRVTINRAERAARSLRNRPAWDGKSGWSKFAGEQLRNRKLLRLNKLYRVLGTISKYSLYTAIASTATNLGIRYYCSSSCK
jgi:RHS repeat-associated protein